GLYVFNPDSLDLEAFIPIAGATGTQVQVPIYPDPHDPTRTDPDATVPALPGSLRPTIFGNFLTIDLAALFPLITISEAQLESVRSLSPTFYYDPAVSPPASIGPFDVDVVFVGGLRTSLTYGVPQL